jgi:hypothetical protein
MSKDSPELQEGMAGITKIGFGRLPDGLPDAGRWGIKVSPPEMTSLAGQRVRFVKQSTGEEKREVLGQCVAVDSYGAFYRIGKASTPPPPQPSGNGNGVRLLVDSGPAPEPVMEPTPRPVGGGLGEPPEPQGPTLTQQAVRYLAERCNYASTWDGAGFNKFDADFGHQMAELETLTDKQEEKTVLLLRKYRKQLSGGGFEFQDIVDDFKARRAARPTPMAVAARRVEVLPDDRGELRFLLIAPWDADLVEAFRQLPDRRWHSEENPYAGRYKKVNSAPLERCLEVEAFAAQHGFTVSEQARQVIEEQRGAAEVEQAKVTQLIEASQAHDADIDLPDTPDGLELRPFQRAGIQYALDRRRTFIADEMGLGKTVEALMTAETDEAFPMLVICPKSVVPSWRREATKWLPRRSVQVLDAQARAQEGIDITIVHYDVLMKRAEVLNSGYRALVLDESHFVKNRKAQRTEAVKTIAENLEGDDPIILCLSGTPLVNRPAELITQLTIMNRLKDLGGFRKFWHRYCGGDQRGAQHLNELNVQLRANCMVRRLKKDVLTELPPRTFAEVETAIDNRAEYRRAEEAFLTWVAETGGDVAAASRAETLVKLTKLRGLAAQGKLESALRWIEEFLESDGKLIVFAHHKPILDALVERLQPFNPVTVLEENTTAQREANIDRFQEDEDVRVIVCSLKTGGMGITLTAASNVAFLELGWTPADMVQAVDRAHRIGQRDAVTGWQIVAPDTIDDFMAEILEEKRLIMEQVLDGRAAEAGLDESMTGELIKRMMDRRYS